MLLIWYGTSTAAAAARAGMYVYHREVRAMGRLVRAVEGDSSVRPIGRLVARAPRPHVRPAPNELG